MVSPDAPPSLGITSAVGRGYRSNAVRAPHLGMVDALAQGDLARWSDGVTMDLATSSAAIPAYYRHRPGARRLLVLLPGAVDRERSDVSFQRASWAADFDAHVLAVSDPTLLVEPGLALGWFQGVGDGPLLGDLAVWIGRFTQSLAVAAPEVTLFGSSAGGFVGLKLTEHLPDAKVVAVNPQIYLDRYVADHFAAMIAISYPWLTIDNAVAECARELWVHPSAADRAATTVIAQNWADRLHYKKHLKPYLEDAGREPPELTELETWCDARQSSAAADRAVARGLEVVVYCDFARGHVPPERPIETRLINSVVNLPAPKH